MMKITIKTKEYYLKNNNWYSLNKKGKEYKVIGHKILKKLEQEKILSEQDLGTEGLGDVVEKITKKMGIEPCDGCKKRKKKLNKMFNWLNKSRDLTEKEERFVISLSKRKQMSGQEQKRLFKLYNEITRSKLKICNCSGLILKMIERLNNFVEILKDEENE